VHCCCGWLPVGQLLFLIVMVCEPKLLGFIHENFRDFVLQGLLYKYGQPHFTNNIAFRWTRFGGFHQNYVINILSTVTIFSTCDSLHYLDDMAFSTFAILSPLVTKFCYSYSASPKINNTVFMT
jgi:hypothetical protein